MSLLITGSSGFLGKSLLNEVITQKRDFKLLNRKALATVALDKQVT